MRFVWLCLAALLLSPAFAGDFSDWAAIVVAGDATAHSGAPSEVFDNGRAKIAEELVQIGFTPDHVRQFSTQPEKYADKPLPSTVRGIAQELGDLAKHATGGCLAYFTSHGSDQGIAMGDDILPPSKLAYILDSACGNRPAVVIVSACYSGVFVRKLKAPQRIVLTAAAADRSSFGCGETDRYTFFDTCTVELLPAAGDFESFGRDMLACVRKREKKEHMSPPSNPQFVVGADTAGLIPHWK